MVKRKYRAVRKVTRTCKTGMLAGKSIQKIIVKLKKETVENREPGMHVTDLALPYEMVKLTASAILNNK